MIKKNTKVINNVFFSFVAISITARLYAHTNLKSFVMILSCLVEFANSLGKMKNMPVKREENIFNRIHVLREVLANSLIPSMAC